MIRSISSLILLLGLAFGASIRREVAFDISPSSTTKPGVSYHPKVRRSPPPRKFQYGDPSRWSGLSAPPSMKFAATKQSSTDLGALGGNMEPPGTAEAPANLVANAGTSHSNPEEIGVMRPPLIKTGSVASDPGISAVTESAQLYPDSLNRNLWTPAFAAAIQRHSGVNVMPLINLDALHGNIGSRIAAGSPQIHSDTHTALGTLQAELEYLERTFAWSLVMDFAVWLIPPGHASYRSIALLSYATGGMDRFHDGFLALDLEIKRARDQKVPGLMPLCIRLDNIRSGGKYWSTDIKDAFIEHTLGPFAVSAAADLREAKDTNPEPKHKLSKLQKLD